MYIGPMNPGKAPATPAVNVRLSESDYLKVAELAARDGAGLAGFVRTLVRRHLESQPGATS